VGCPPQDALSVQILDSRAIPRQHHNLGIIPDKCLQHLALIAGEFMQRLVCFLPLLKTSDRFTNPPEEGDDQKA
jgi:hypothetical protein